MADLAGPGVVTRLWMTTLAGLNRGALRDLVLRGYWDGEAAPSVEAPLGDFFGAPFGHYAPYAAIPMSLTSGGFTCLLPMPFARAARLELANEGGRTVDPVFYEVTYQRLDNFDDPGLRFHAQWRRECPTREGEPYTVLEAHGSGHYVGCHLFMQNRAWWLRLPVSAMLFPGGLGMGMLEGQARVWIDGEAEPALVGTGTEDFFNAGWYFANGRAGGPFHGCTERSVVSGRVAAYRFEIGAPMAFRRSLRLTFDHGWENQVEADYASTAYWYQTEPHRPFETLPGAAGRRPAAARDNVLQFWLSLGAPGIMTWVLPRVVRGR